MSAADYPQSPIDYDTIVATCPASDCNFDGDVEAEAWLIASSYDGTTIEYHWTCEGCGLEVVEDREIRHGDDDA